MRFRYECESQVRRMPAASLHFRDLLYFLRRTEDSLHSGRRKMPFCNRLCRAARSGRCRASSRPPRRRRTRASPSAATRATPSSSCRASPARSRTRSLDRALSSCRFNDSFEFIANRAGAPAQADLEGRDQERQGRLLGHHLAQPRRRQDAVRVQGTRHRVRQEDSGKSEGVLGC